MNKSKILQIESLNNIEEQQESKMENISQPNEVAGVHMKGHLVITDKNSGEVLLDKEKGV